MHGGVCVCRPSAREMIVWLVNVQFWASLEEINAVMVYSPHTWGSLCLSYCVCFHCWFFSCPGLLWLARVTGRLPRQASKWPTRSTSRSGRRCGPVMSFPIMRGFLQVRVVARSWCVASKAFHSSRIRLPEFSRAMAGIVKPMSTSRPVCWISKLKSAAARIPAFKRRSSPLW